FSPTFRRHARWIYIPHRILISVLVRSHRLLGEWIYRYEYRSPRVVISCAVIIEASLFIQFFTIKFIRVVKSPRTPLFRKRATLANFEKNRVAFSLICTKRQIQEELIRVSKVVCDKGGTAQMVGMEIKHNWDKYNARSWLC